MCTGHVGRTIGIGLLLASAAFAADWEAGGSLGYGWYRNLRVNVPGAQAAAGIRDRFVAGAVLSENLYEHFTGEIRYTYHDGDPFITLNGRTANVRGQSHSFTYDTLIHARGRESRLRPYLAAGIGAKLYRVTGPSSSQPPASGLAFPGEANQWRVLVSVGAGVSYRFPNHLVLRADFRDYISPAPRNLFIPAGGATVRGLMHQLTPMVGIGVWF